MKSSQFPKDMKDCVLALQMRQGNSNIVADLSPEHNHGEIFGAVRSWNNGLIFNSCYIDCGNDASLDITGDLSLEIGMNINTYETKNPLFNIGTNGAYYLELYQRTPPSNRVIFWHNSTAVLSAIDLLEPINTWQHLVITRSHTTDKKVRMYVNGNLVATSAAYVVDPAAATQNLILGAYSTFFLNGIIDEARIYKRDLTAAEAFKRYTNSKIARWKALAHTKQD